MEAVRLGETHLEKIPWRTSSGCRGICREWGLDFASGSSVWKAVRSPRNTGRTAAMGGRGPAMSKTGPEIRRGPCQNCHFSQNKGVAPGIAFCPDFVVG